MPTLWNPVPGLPSEAGVLLGSMLRCGVVCEEPEAGMSGMQDGVPREVDDVLQVVHGKPLAADDDAVRALPTRRQAGERSPAERGDSAAAKAEIEEGAAYGVLFGEMPGRAGVVAEV
jgi:hypothetical protein